MNQQDRKQFQELKDMVVKIHDGLYGDSDNDNPGLVTRLKAVEDFVQKMGNAKWYVAGVIGFISAAGGVIIFFLAVADKIRSLINS